MKFCEGGIERHDDLVSLFSPKNRYLENTMPRTMLPATLWNTLFLFMQQNGLVYNKEEHRLTFEGILYRMKTGIPWRNLPDEFGKWNTVFRRFNA